MMVLMMTMEVMLIDDDDDDDDEKMPSIYPSIFATYLPNGEKAVHLIPYL